jgi:PPOX class probable F420-dependent enzyme
MPSHRDRIRMSDDEVRAFLAEHRTVVCATMGQDGRPHLMPLWYVQEPDGRTLRAWTYAKSQKARNLERDPRATLEVDTGEEYDDLRGVMLECDVHVERDTAKVEEYGLAILTRYGAEATVEVQEAVRAQAPKRVGLRFIPTRVVSWDHRKLEGAY